MLRWSTDLRSDASDSLYLNAVVNIGDSKVSDQKVDIHDVQFQQLNKIGIR